AGGERRLALVERPAKPPAVHAYPTPGYEIRDSDEHWQVGAGLATAELTRAKGLRVDAFLFDELTEYVLSPAGKAKPLPEEFMDLNRDGHGFDTGDWELAQQGLWTEAPVGGERTIWRYHHKDFLGSAVSVSDRIGDVVSSRRFHPYGDTVELRGVLPSIGYAGSGSEPDEDTGLVRMGSRYYAPALGRWITPDRFVGEQPKWMIEQTFESGLYGYAQNNPIGFRDPTGKTIVLEGTPDERTRNEILGGLQELTRDRLELFTNADGKFEVRIAQKGTDKSDRAVGTDLVSTLIGSKSIVRIQLGFHSSHQAGLVTWNPDREALFVKSAVPGKSDVEWSPGYVILGHELVHASRHIDGKTAYGERSQTFYDSQSRLLRETQLSEELATVGITRSHKGISENAIRREHGLPPRTAYVWPKDMPSSRTRMVTVVQALDIAAIVEGDVREQLIPAKPK
ncbi:MAG TPA: RHS repeat-associated core domain-containing protein, partial [Polyangiaceae bacterium]|nr:RHS repeat-associated core domain-containing protein [Polyangiaceae bacterium]